jgi:hypothetical protein
MRQFKAAFVLIVLAFIAPSIHAQNVNDMVKWTSAQVVHYDVFAEYAGNTNVLLVGKDGKSITFVDKMGWTYAYTLSIVK